MDNSKEMLTFLDMLDLDEDLVDSRLKTIMERSNHSKKQLSNMLQLLHYKNLINQQDKTDCDNSEEFEFVVKLIQNIHPDIADNVCKITTSVLSLNSSTLVSNSQHLLQQLLANIDLSPNKPKCTVDDADQSQTLLYFKVCDSVLDTVIQHGLKIDLLFMEVPLEKAICHSNENVKIHFITSTVPKLFKGIIGFSILDSIWSYVKELEDIEVSLKVLSSLSDYFLPVVDGKGDTQFESEVVYQYEFWRITLFGLMSADFTYRKISVYLAKRAIDYIVSKKRNINIKTKDHIIFTWDHKKTDVLRKQWDNFFILIDSLEEKQSNIVMPSLQLFGAINDIHTCWVNCAFNLGLKHDNSQVRLKCVEHQLKRKINNVTEAVVLIQALDDINFYDNAYDIMILKGKIMEMLKDGKSLVHVLEAIPKANLSPVPLFHLVDTLPEIDRHVSFTADKNVSEILTEIMKAPCNIIALRKAVLINISHFVGKCCKGLDWKVFAKVFSLLLLETAEIENTENPLVELLDSKLTYNEGDRRELFKHATSTLADIDFGLLYLDKHPEDIHFYIEIINDKIQHVNNIMSRQYSNKLECFNDVLMILKIFSKCKGEKEIITYVITHELKLILQYIHCLLTSDTVLTVDETKSLFQCLKHADIIVREDIKEIFNQLYKSSVILLNDSNIEFFFEKGSLSMFIINNLSDNKTFVENFKHEMLDIKDLLDLAKVFGKRDIQTAQSIGRLKNIFYEKHSETVSIILEDGELKLDTYLKKILDYLDDIIECGGYGCLYWILKIINKILKLLTVTKDVKFDVNQFINRMWREIEELKTNNHNYSPCMEEFAHLITHEALLGKPEFNNTIIMYCNKIIEYGSIKNNPIYYLARELNRIEINKHGHLVYILGEMLLYCPVSRKDQRISDNLAIEILKNTKFGVKNNVIDLHFNFEVQYVAISMLSRICDAETLNILTSFIMNKIDNIFKHKVRYHGNSQIHRTVQTGLQHLVFTLLLNPNMDSKKILDWCLHLLGKLPHQQSVRICLEWYITLCFYIEKRPIDNQLIDLLKSKNIPVLSQFIILYWLLKHKVIDMICSNNEYEFVLDTLLSHTMGQIFYIRLHAQYLSTKLYEIYKDISKEKYDYTIGVICRTLAENSKDKNFMKLKEDYFVNEFDAVCNLTPYFLYSFLPKLCDSNNNEIYNKDFVTHIVNEININISSNDNNTFTKEWKRCRLKDEEFIKIELNKHVDGKAVEELEKIGTLQKKYIPWKNMSDVNVYEATKKRESPSDLIVVASLIDKLPNLGGMARTSEVFGVKKYVIDSLRHLQDKQFQGLSVSAERWIDIEEIRPGQPLKDYLNRKKAEGYAVVAAEQTSTGSKLQTFKFPTKTLLLLGHEKEGIPCDLLPMMDYCVEIPQQGYVRSLNVHVTAAIFIWEYARQNLL